MKCVHCDSDDLRIDKCRCGIPCIVTCNACKRRNYDAIPHDKSLKKLRTDAPGYAGEPSDIDYGGSDFD